MPTHDDKAPLGASLLELGAGKLNGGEARGIVAFAEEGNVLQALGKQGEQT